MTAQRRFWTVYNEWLHTPFWRPVRWWRLRQKATRAFAVWIAEDHDGRSCPQAG